MQNMLIREQVVNVWDVRKFEIIEMNRTNGVRKVLDEVFLVRKDRIKSNANQINRFAIE